MTIFKVKFEARVVGDKIPCDGIMLVRCLIKFNVKGTADKK